MTIEQQRFDELYRGNHRCSHLYTNYTQGIIYRCPLPECGGATVNPRGIKRSLATHHKAFHRDLQQIQFTFKIEMARGWDYLSIPDRSAPGTSFQQVVSSQEQSETGEREPPGSQGSPGATIGPAVEEVTRGELTVKEVSTLRQALLGEAASAGRVVQFQGRRGKHIRPEEQTGVYCVQGGDKGSGHVCDLGNIFHQGASLQTVHRDADNIGSQSAEIL